MNALRLAGFPVVLLATWIATSVYVLTSLTDLANTVA